MALNAIVAIVAIVYLGPPPSATTPPSIPPVLLMFAWFPADPDRSLLTGFKH
jgi:hypothetical protein